MQKNIDIIVPPHLTTSDVVSWVIRGLLLLPSLGLTLTTAVTSIPSFILMYIFTLTPADPKGCKMINRDTITFNIFAPIIVLLGLPTALIMGLWAVLCLFITLLLSLPFGLYNFSRTKRSFKAMYLFHSKGQIKSGDTELDHLPPTSPISTGNVPCESFDIVSRTHFWSPYDIVCGLIGGSNRRHKGIFEAWYNTFMTGCLSPFSMGIPHRNFMLYDFKLHMINQTSIPITDEYNTLHDTKHLLEWLDKYYAHCDPTGPVDILIDSNISFSAHYQDVNMKGNKRAVFGIQPLKHIPIDFATHVVKNLASQDTVSPFSEKNSVSVWLKPTNLWHVIVGYVEVNITDEHEIEHPMWMLMDTNSRVLMGNVALIDNIFDSLVIDIALKGAGKANLVIDVGKRPSLFTKVGVDTDTPNEAERLV